MTCDNHHLARIAFLRAIRLDRRNASAWYHRGLLYRDGFGYLEAALEQFEIFSRLEEEASPRVQKVQRTVIPALKESISRAATERPGASKRNSAACAAAIAKAEDAMKKGRFRDAREAYALALKSDPLSYPAALGLAKAWEKTDSTKAGQEKAFDAYKTACMLRPSAVSTFLAAGSLAAKLGFSLQAVEIYSRAVAANPASPDAIDGLIRALRKTGGKAKVAEAYQQYRLSLARK
jgi:tetratricopeptide (TPR) repeat protein